MSLEVSCWTILRAILAALPAKKGGWTAFEVLTILLPIILFCFTPDYTHWREAALKDLQSTGESKSKSIYMPKLILQMRSTKAMQVRMNGRMNSPSISVIAPGQIATILKRERDWTFIELKTPNGVIAGWVLTRYLESLE